MEDLYCKLCTLQFDNKSTFNLHLSIEHEENSDDVKQKSLKPGFDSDETSSILELSNESKSLFRCSICDKKFKQKHVLIRHTSALLVYRASK